jgi:hypothetical protein
MCFYLSFVNRTNRRNLRNVCLFSFELFALIFTCAVYPGVLFVQSRWKCAFLFGPLEEARSSRRFSTYACVNHLEQRARAAISASVAAKDCTGAGA